MKIKTTPKPHCLYTTPVSHANPTLPLHRGDLSPGAASAGGGVSGMAICRGWGLGATASFVFASLPSMSLPGRRSPTLGASVVVTLATRHLSGFCWGPPTQDTGRCCLRMHAFIGDGICRADGTCCHDSDSLSGVENVSVLGEEHRCLLPQHIETYRYP